MKIENLRKAAILQKKMEEIDYVLEIISDYDEIVLRDTVNQCMDFVFPYSLKFEVKKVLKDVANKHKDELLKEIEKLKLIIINKIKQNV